MELQTIKQRQRQTWGTGDYGMVANTIVVVSELLCDAVDLRSTRKVLDVATGTGNTALAAARRFCDVTGVDYVPSLLERARERAAVDRLKVQFEEGDAEKLPYPDRSFDYVLSTFGVMFAPDQTQAAGELLRVCRPGGKIGLANWTPESYAGEMFRMVTKYLPPPPVLKPPTRWGTDEGVRELFGDRVSHLQAFQRSVIWRYPSPQFWLDYFRTYFGPTKRTFEALDSRKQEQLAGDLLQLVGRKNRSDDETLVMAGEYLEVVAVRK
jgi:ubiquinone/menaquinone biosynthesis C-methylase UbiE